MPIPSTCGLRNNGGENTWKEQRFCKRKTKETEIAMSLNLDGSGKTSIHTGIGFLDHMLDGFARHGLFDLEISVKETWR